MRVPSRDLLPRVLKGEVAAIALLLSRAEAADPECRETLGEIYARAGKSHVIGITGVPGSGKSTMVAVLGRRLREAGHKVGIIAIDPSSPYSGGSIMGDRIRMSELAGDEGVYIRSMATRGALGGMARATLVSIDASAAWRPPVVATSSLKSEGFEELVAALEKHKAFLEASEAGRARSRKIAEFRMLKTAEDLLRIRFHERSAGLVRGMADRLVSREISPYAAGEQLIEAMGARNP